MSSDKNSRNKDENDVACQKEELLRRFLHIKDEYHITDNAIKAMHKFFRETKVSFYSMAQIDRVQKKANKNIPLKYTKDSAYVPFEFALRAAVFVAAKFQPDLLKLNHLSFRLNMDGTLMDILAEASRTGEYEPAHTKKLEEKIDVLNKHATNTIGKRFFFKLETENNVKTIVSCGRFSGHLQEVFFVDMFPYEKVIENLDSSKNARNLVNKFKFILQLIKTEKSKRTSNLAKVAKSFVKDFRLSGLRAGCTPYMHLIGTHLAEQDKNEDLRAYDMQGVEKSNDLLSRLYFSSSNRARNPLRTMIQNLYRRLEMNFADPKDRAAMNRYSLKGTWTTTDDEEDSNSIDEISTCSFSSIQSDESSVDDSEEQEENDELEDDDVDQAPYYVTQNSFAANRTKNRWKSFKKNTTIEFENS
ncbi:unnamed protein product [Rotaria sp. Silwood2]|nr:unnamed protein product [Rotaria sp. Silwood2]